MADQLYLSLWFPNFRLEGLPDALVGVLRQFAIVAGDARVRAASAYPIDFTESPTYQRIFVTDDRAADTPDTAAAHIDRAIAEATEQLHEDMAYEFEMAWNLWLPDPVRAETVQQSDERNLSERNALEDPEDSKETRDTIAPRDIPLPSSSLIEFPSTGSTPHQPAPAVLWRRRPATVRILGFGPEFDAAGYSQNGHIRVDFGLDTPWTMEADEPGGLAHPAGGGIAFPLRSEEASTLTKHIQQNVEMLLAFTLLVEKHCNLSSRLLWTESGEPIAEKLIASLQRLH